MDQIIIFAAKYLFVVAPPLAILVFFLIPRDKKARFLVFSALSLALSLSLAKLLNKLIYTPRPFIVEKVQPLIEHEADNGFPSDHTLLVATIATIIFAYNRRIGVIIGVIALVVGVARILAKVHSPVDIAGSVLIAAVATYLSYFALAKLKMNVNI